MLFMIDARAGALPADRAFADLVRRSGKPAIVVANKAEGRAAAAGVLEAYALGLGDPVAISAEHGEGLADLFEALRAALPEATADAEAETASRRSGGEAGTAPDPRRRRRPAELRQVDAGEPAARRGAPADRARGRHHPRHHRGRADWHGRASACTTPPGMRRRAAHPGEAREALGRRRAQRHPLRRGGGAADGRAERRSRSRTCASPTSSSARAGRW